MRHGQRTPISGRALDIRPAVDTINLVVQLSAECPNSPQQDAPEFREGARVVSTPLPFQFSQQDPEVCQRLF